MQPVSFPTRQQRAHYRHEPRSLTYVTLDEANGGIIRDLNREGVAVQAVGALHAQQRVRLRFELRFPRLRVETYGQVAWASASGKCGIRFVDLSPRTSHQIDQWIFSNLLDAMARDADHPRSILGASVVSIAREENVREESVEEENDGLTLSPQPRPAIVLEPSFARPEEPLHDLQAQDPRQQPNWLSRPLSARTLAWMVDTLVVIAGLLLFALIFLSIAHELPQWPLAVGGATAAAVLVVAAYRALFAIFGGKSLGRRLAHAAYLPEVQDESEAGSRFR
jgi:hypothetical protein